MACNNINIILLFLLYRIHVSARVTSLLLLLLLYMFADLYVHSVQTLLYIDFFTTLLGLVLVLVIE